jgi:uncharacterized membrane protein YfcA
MKIQNFKSYQWAFTATILIIWLSYMTTTNQWYLFKDYWFMTVTMIFGSFIAGATAEGGGAVAFPVMTLIFKITPEIARNFSLAIQSCGMTAAAYFIFARKTSIEKTYLIFGSLGGFFGLIFGSYAITPYLSPAYTKMFFVSLWLSFGVALFYLNTHQKREVKEQLPPLNKKENIFLIFIGFLGGIVTAIAGSGLDILTFSVVTTRYHLSEKVATPTSVCLMAGNTVIGFLLHSFIIKDFGIQEFHYWLVAIPVVIFFAPFGAYFISNKTRDFIAKLLYLVLLIQFIGACLIIPVWKSISLLLFTIGIFITGVCLFWGLSSQANTKSISLKEF